LSALQNFIVIVLKLLKQLLKQSIWRSTLTVHIYSKHMWR